MGKPRRCTACGQPTPPDAHVLALLDRLAKVVAAMAQDTALHDQMFDLMADIEALRLGQR